MHRNLQKIGKVMWARTEFGEMVPVDLHGKLTREDEAACNHVHETLQAYRKLTPALRIVTSKDWGNMPLIKPYLKESMTARSEARTMKMNDDWEPFWAVLGEPDMDLKRF